MILTPDATNFDKVMGGRMGPGDTITPHQQLIGVKSGSWLHLVTSVWCSFLPLNVPPIVNREVEAETFVLL